MPQFEVTFRDTTGKDRFPDKYGFGGNPPAIFTAHSKKTLRKMLAPKIKKYKVKITSIKKS